VLHRAPAHQVWGPDTVKKKRKERKKHRESTVLAVVVEQQNEWFVTHILEYPKVAELGEL
jgi:hypothetical protein